MHVTDYREFGWPYLQADDSADVAAMATVLALGLYESTDRFRFQDPSAPIPAPGIDGLVDEVRTHAAATAFAAANARTLYQDLSTRSVSGAAIGDPQSDGPLVDFDDPAVVNLAGALDAAAAQAAAATAQANRALRRLAQIAFGVVQHGTDDGDVAAIRRACAEVLEDGEHAAPAEFDDHTVVGRTRPEIVVEIAGAIARYLACPMPLATRITLVAEGASTRSLTFVDGGSLHVEDLGTFLGPVGVVEVVEAVLDVYGQIDGIEPTDLTILWESLPDV